MSQLQTKFIADNAITSAKIPSDAITTVKILNDNVTDTKIRLANNASLRGRNNAGSGDISIIKVNTSDKPEFGAAPNFGGFEATNAADPTASTSLATKNYVDGLVNGLSWKNPVRAATTTAGTLATSFENGDVIDGVTLSTGDRILLKDQTAGEDNGIYIVAASGAPSRSADMDSSAETNAAAVFVTSGTANADKGFVQTADSVTLGTTPLVFTQFSSASATPYTGGDMITVSSFAISVDLATVSGLESSNPGNAAGQLRVKLESSNPSLQIDGSNQLGAKLDGAGAIVSGTSGLAVNLATSNPGLAITTDKLDVKYNASGAIVATSTGISTQVDSATIKINGSNQLQSTSAGKETFILSSGDITNQFLDLAQVAQTNSIDFKVKGGGALLEGASYDYSVSYTGGAGGKTRVTFLNDLATGGVSALVAADVVQIAYRYL